MAISTCYFFITADFSNVATIAWNVCRKFLWQIEMKIVTAVFSHFCRTFGAQFERTVFSLCPKNIQPIPREGLASVFSSASKVKLFLQFEIGNYQSDRSNRGTSKKMLQNKWRVPAPALLGSQSAGNGRRWSSESKTAPCQVYTSTKAVESSAILRLIRNPLSGNKPPCRFFKSKYFVLWEPLFACGGITGN